MKEFKIAVLRGDGIESKSLRRQSRCWNTRVKNSGYFCYDEQLLGGCAIDACGEPLPQATVDACKKSDAVLLGAVGGWKWDTLPGSLRPEAGLLGIRAALGLFANLRRKNLRPAEICFAPERQHHR